MRCRHQHLLTQLTQAHLLTYITDACLLACVQMHTCWTLQQFKADSKDSPESKTCQAVLLLAVASAPSCKIMQVYMR